MFMLIIWLQGIWLPEHGYSFSADPALGRPLHAAADRRLPDRRADLRASSPTGTARAYLATGGMLTLGARLRAAREAADQLLLPRVRRDPAADGALDGRVRLAQPRRRDEQPAAGASRRRRRHEPDVPELGAGALDRDLLHADDHRPLGDPPPHPQPGLEAHGVPAATADPDRPSAARLRALRRVPRLQPGRGARPAARARAPVAPAASRCSTAAASSRT